MSKGTWLHCCAQIHEHAHRLRDPGPALEEMLHGKPSQIIFDTLKVEKAQVTDHIEAGLLDPLGSSRMSWSMSAGKGPQ